jgi:hypothetical protein
LPVDEGTPGPPEIAASESSRRGALAEPVMDELERILTVKLGFDSARWREVETLLTDMAAESIPTPQACSQGCRPTSAIFAPDKQALRERS